MAWLFEQKTGRLYEPDGNLFALGYSGADAGRNNPKMQTVADKGPIPVGLYHMQEPVDTQKHGPFVIWLTPDEANDMHGRSDFGIHGDSLGMPGTASKGCVVVPRFARERMWASGDHDLLVQVEVVPKSKV